jgi:hypothetical protein
MVIRTRGSMQLQAKMVECHSILDALAMSMLQPIDREIPFNVALCTRTLVPAWVSHLQQAHKECR